MELVALVYSENDTLIGGGVYKEGSNNTKSMLLSDIVTLAMKSRISNVSINHFGGITGKTKGDAELSSLTKLKLNKGKLEVIDPAIFIVDYEIINNRLKCIMPDGKLELYSLDKLVNEIKCLRCSPANFIINTNGVIIGFDGQKIKTTSPILNPKAFLMDTITELTNGQWGHTCMMTKDNYYITLHTYKSNGKLAISADLYKDYVVEKWANLDKKSYIIKEYDNTYHVNQLKLSENTEYINDIKKALEKYGKGRFRDFKDTNDIKSSYNLSVGDKNSLLLYHSIEFKTYIDIKEQYDKELLTDIAKRILQLNK